MNQGKSYRLQNPKSKHHHYKKISFWNLPFVIWNLPPSGGFFVSFKHNAGLLRAKSGLTYILFGRDLPALKRANPL